VPTGSKLTTTSFAILGLLAIRPWSSYELTQQMRRSLGRFWPRAESKLYEEPKKLAGAGLATSAPAADGRRRRTVYTVTPDGRRALADWLATPSTGGPVVEFEQLLKVFFAEHGTKSDLLATLESVRAWAQERAAEDAAIARSYASGAGHFPHRAAQLVLVGRWSADLAAMTGRWADWAREGVQDWPEDLTAAAPDLAALEEIADRHPPDRSGPAGT
jgi:PadR family transcriptional regulator, regulatory protein AphA